jgi:hypothetical protein
MRMFMTAHVVPVSALCVWTAVLGTGVAGCDHPAHSSFGSVALTVTVPSDVEVQLVEYEITGNGIMPLAGRIKTPHPQQQFARLVTHVPSGTDYPLSVSAKSTDGQKLCAAAATIEVRKQTTTRVHLALPCQGIGDGMVHISVGIACPGVHLVSYTVSPLTASIGGTIAVTAVPGDPDSGALTFAWTASSGTFADPAASHTTFQCATAGPVTITLRTQGDICQENDSLEVTCLPRSGDAGSD